MGRRILIGVSGVIAAVIALAAIGVTRAHLAIRHERRPLPTGEAIVTNLAGDDRPVRLTYINTATQAMPRSAVLDAKLDPHPAEPFVMSHPSFVLEWADGRILLIDTGMTHDGAVKFGKPIQWMTGGGAIEPLVSVAHQLGDAAQRVRGVVFTHLHTDHTGGIHSLCKAVHHHLRVFMTVAQTERVNYTSRPGLRLIKGAHCVRPEILPDAPLIPVHSPTHESFPGVFVIPAGGHTPDSQIIVAYVAGPDTPRTYVFVGDIVNNIDGVTYDVPKPFLYRTFIVPEDETRQSELRLFLRELRDRFGFTLLVSHDQQAIERSGIAPWTNDRPAAVPADDQKSDTEGQDTDPL